MSIGNCGSEIKSFDPSDIPKPPSGFPFEIEDDPEATVVKLRREFDGEKLAVLVFDPIYPEDEAADGEEIPEKICGGCPNIDRIQINVNIRKEDGEELEINFWGFVGRVGFHPTLFEINGISFFDEKVLGFDWEEIVRARGVDDSVVEFMVEYMNRRADRHHWITLKKFRDFLKE